MNRTETSKLCFLCFQISQFSTWYQSIDPYLLETKTQERIAKISDNKTKEFVIDN